MNAKITEDIKVENKNITENVMRVMQYRATNRGKDPVIEVGSDSDKLDASVPENNYCLHVKSRNDSLNIPSKNVFDYVRTILDSGTPAGTSAGTSTESSGIFNTSLISASKRLDQILF